VLFDRNAAIFLAPLWIDAGKRRRLFAESAALF
jgi:hypothetical protein